MALIGVAGATGKMGRTLIRAVHEHPELKLASAWEAKGHPLVGQDAQTLAGLEPGQVAVRDDLEQAVAACECIIDFTAPEATSNLIKLAERQGKAMVIGTTGLSLDQHNEMKQAAQSIGIVYATNFSTGVNLLWTLAKKAAQILGESFNAEIIEAHHNLKKDAPSGTALTLLEYVCAGKGLDPKNSAQHGREGLIGARNTNEVGVHALRAGDIVGDHTVLFAGPGERLEIKHQAHSRDTFARGASRAAAWLVSKQPGLYHMTDVLDLNV